VDLTSKPIAPRVSLVCVHDPRVRWSVRASQVVRIIAATEWAAERIDAPPLDVVDALGGYPRAGGEARRVLVIRGIADREIALLAAGPIEIGEVDPGDVLALPAAFAATASQVAGIIIASDASLSLLLEPSAVTTPEDSVSGEEL
jgi:hypothetical protein